MHYVDEVTEPKDADDDWKYLSDGDYKWSNVLLEFRDDVVHEHLSEQVHNADADNVPNNWGVVDEELKDRPKLEGYHAVAKTEPEDPFIDLEHEIEGTRFVDWLHLCLKVR